MIFRFSVVRVPFWSDWMRFFLIIFIFWECLKTRNSFFCLCSYWWQAVTCCKHHWLSLGKNNDMAGNEQSSGSEVFFVRSQIWILILGKSLPEVRRWGSLNLPYTCRTISIPSKISGWIFGHWSGWTFWQISSSDWTNFFHQKMVGGLGREELEKRWSNKSNMAIFTQKWFATELAES